MANKPNVYIALLHYPIYNKNMEIITTAITNMDLHDISRSATTYNVKRYFVVHPLEAQQALIKEILDYWQEGFGGNYNPDRKEAFSRIELSESLEKTVEKIAEENNGHKPVVISTDARTYPNTVSYAKLRNEMETADKPYLILFGTGWGIEKELMQSFDYILQPIYGAGDYNHLSVRSAVAIILDRLLGEKWWA